MSGLYSIVRPLLHAIDPEIAHDMTITGLKAGLVPRISFPIDARLNVNVLGIEFPNPLGLAAGFDKNAEVPDAMLAQGFGFVEVGSVTPRPQPGNPKPRLFRLSEDAAVINRMGFNNDGHARVLRRMLARSKQGGIVGLNLGANKDSEDRIADYALGAAAFNHVASYITVNVSSPNTPGLRQLQARTELQDLIKAVTETRDNAAKADNRRAPLVLKIAPDLTEAELEEVTDICLKMGIDGIIVSNTTIARPNLRSPYAIETGGLSGAPLMVPSTICLARVHKLTNGKIPLIGAGGIASTEDAWQKLRAGASLLQMYSALVYQGPDLIQKILRGLLQQLDACGFQSVSSVTGAGVDEWCARKANHES
jgi:dihydroorotate dehydrogenase